MNNLKEKEKIGYLLKPIEITEYPSRRKSHVVLLDTVLIERENEVYFINGLSRIQQANALRDEETAKAERKLLEKLILEKQSHQGRGEGEGAAKANAWRKWKEVNGSTFLKCNHFYPIYNKKDEPKKQQKTD
jgi:hypothetical protein